MTQQEINKRMAEIMGWTIIDDSEPKQASRPTPCIRDAGTHLSLIHHDGAYGDGYERYNPAEDLQQAWAAAEAWRKQKRTRRQWSVVSPSQLDLSDEGTFFVRLVDGTDEFWASNQDAALAICTAIIKAVKGEDDGS